MDKLNVEKQEKQVCAPLREYGGEQPFDCRITLPEYLGDIVRVLRCTASVIPGNAAVAAERITAEGTVRVKVAYLADNGGVYTYDTTEQFSKSIDAPGIPADCALDAVIAADRAVCRAVSPRSLEVKTVIRMTFHVYDKATRGLVVSAEGAGVQLRKAEADVFDLETVAAKQFTAEGGYTLPAENNAVERILSADASCHITETRVISNKAMVRGDVTIQTLYVSDSTPEPETAKFSIAFSEIVDAAGVNDSMSVRVSAEVLNVDVTPKAARGGGMRELEGAAIVALRLSAGKMRRIPIVTDAFSTAYETACTTAAVNAVTDSRVIAESFTAEGRISLEELSPQRILYSAARVGAVRVHAADDGVRAEGSVQIGLFVKSQGDTVNFTEKNIDFSFEKGMQKNAESYEFAPTLSLTAADVALDGKDAVVRAEIFIEGRLDAVNRQSVLTQITVDESRPKRASAAGMVIYFPTAGETLWDIAKRYNASPEMLAGDNGLENDVADGGAPLLIACV